MLQNQKIHIINLQRNVQNKSTTNAKINYKKNYIIQLTFLI